MSGLKEFIDAASGRDLSLVTRLFKAQFVNQRLNGRTALHCASKDSSGDIVRYLLSAGFVIECEDGKWWRPIHCAAWAGNIESMEALIEGGCSLDSVDRDGRTPLDIARQSGKRECVRLLEDAQAKRRQIKEQKVKVPVEVKAPEKVTEPTDLELFQQNSLSKIIDTQTGKTLLDKLLTNNDPAILEAIKSKPVEEKEIIDCISLKLRRIDAESYKLLRECLLYRCIRQEYTRGFEKLCTADIVNQNKLFMGPSTLECVAECGLQLFVQHVLRKLVAVDETWTRAENIAKKKGLTEVSKMISSRKAYLSRRKKRGLSRLHIAVCDNTTDMIEYLLEKDIVKADEGDKTIGTALSFAYESDFIDCAESLHNFNVNTNTTDWLNRSPLHWAICNRIEDDQVKYLTQKTEDVEVEDYRGLRVLDRAIINDCRIICEQLSPKMVEIDKYIRFNSEFPDYDSSIRPQPHLPITNHETVLSLCIKLNRTIYPCLLRRIDQGIIDIVDSDNNTLLHLSAVLLLPDVCSQLISSSANIHSVNTEHNTPLLELLQQNKSHNFGEIKEVMIETVNVLINAGASLDSETESGLRVFDLASEYKNEELLVSIIRNIKPLSSIRNQLWHRWVYWKYYILIKEVIDRADKAFLQETITTHDIKNIVKDADIDLIMALYDKSATNVQEFVSESILYRAATSNDEELFKKMVNKSMRSDSFLAGGDSLFHYLINERNTRFIEIILRSQNKLKLLEKKDIQNKLPLHISIEYEYWDIVDGIIADTGSVNARDDDGNTPLSLLLSKISETDDSRLINRLMAFVKTLIRSGADITIVNQHNKTPIEFCTKADLKLEIQTFSLRHQAPVVLRAGVAEDVSGAAATKVVNPGPPMLMATDPRLCEICFDQPRDCALNCGHIFCRSCAQREVYCYICRGQITDLRPVYM